MSWKLILLILLGIGLMLLAGRLRQRSVDAAGTRRPSPRRADAALSPAQEVQGIPAQRDDEPPPERSP